MLDRLLPDHRTFQRWNSYVSASAVFLSVILTTFFGALLPLIDWLNNTRAVVWSVSAIMLSIFLYILVRYKLTPTSERTAIGFKIFLFGAFWAVFPFALCSTLSVSGDPTISCLCQKLPPNTKIALRKLDGKIVIENPTSMQELLDRTKAFKRANPVFIHPQEISIILSRMRSSIGDKQAQEFMRDWDDEETQARLGLVRLISAFSGYPLAPSDLSRDFERRIALEIARSQSGVVMLSGDDALKYLQAVMEDSRGYEPMVDRTISEASQKYIQLSALSLYGMLKSVPRRYAEDVDQDFVNFIKNIPDEFEDRVRMVAYPQTSEPLIEFECGNSATELIRGSHSRFFVPEKELDSRTALAMKHGPWPIGTASEYFSEQWWLSNAIWQMLAREHGEWKDRLKLRIASFDSCGPP